MIEVEIKVDGVKIGEIEIRNAGGTLEAGDYICHYIVNRGTAVGAAIRTVHDFPRKRLNVFGLLRLALESLDEKELELERDFDPDETTISTDLAWRFDRALREIQARISRLHNH